MNACRDNDIISSRKERNWKRDQTCVVIILSHQEGRGRKKEISIGEGRGEILVPRKIIRSTLVFN